jgi:hypothetical protein
VNGNGKRGRKSGSGDNEYWNDGGGFQTGGFGERFEDITFGTIGSGEIETAEIEEFETGSGILTGND